MTTLGTQEELQATQLERKKLVAALASKWCRRWFDAEGNWTYIQEANIHSRTVLWLCFGLLEGTSEDVAFANVILSKVEFHLHVRPRSEEEVTSPFDIFVTNQATQLLILHCERLQTAVREKLENWARAGLADYAGNRQSDYQFHGYNDNMPAKATLGLICGGEYFGDDAAVQHGLWNLRQLRDMLTRRGMVSEYTSPTYSPFTLTCLVKIAHYARNEEARELASLCAERVWSDLIGHFHLPTGLVGGPYSRAYQPDRTGHLSVLCDFMWMNFGDIALPNPVKEMDVENPRLLHYHNYLPDAVARLSWVASSAPSVPEYLVEWLRNREYPFTCIATAERGEGAAGFSAGPVLTTHYQEEDFALGTAEGENWSQQQAEVFFLQYRLNTPVAGVEDVRTAYVRYLINDDASKDEDVVSSYGNLHTVQEGRVAMVLARPKLNLAGKDIHRLKLSFHLPIHFSPVQQIASRDGHIFLSDGPLYLALRPLNASMWSEGESCRVETIGNYQLISFLNYEGTPRTFTQAELGRTLNGFVAIIGRKEEETYEAFCQRVLRASCVDYYHGMRTVRYQIDDTLLEMCYAVESDRVRYASINGNLVPTPIWQSTGMPKERLPFLGSSPTPNAPKIPYKHLKVVWAPDLPWTITANGTSEGSSSAGSGWLRNPA